MMKIKIFSFFRMGFSLILLSGSLFAEIICPQCQYKNENSDRYCLNCQFEIRTVSKEEKKSMETLNLQRAQKTLNTLQQEAQKQKERKKIESSESVIPPPLISTEEIPLYIDGKLVKMGMTKQKIRNMLGLHKKLNEDVWDISSGNGLQDSSLYFADNVLVKWEKTVYYDYYIQRKYPLDPQALKTGMTGQEVQSLWGDPDYKRETCSSFHYQLKEAYYLKEPHSETQYVPVGRKGDSPVQNTVVIKEGPLAEIFFDSSKKILELSVRDGELRQGRSLEESSGF